MDKYKNAQDIWKTILSYPLEKARDEWYKKLLICEGEKAAQKFQEEYEWVLAKNPNTTVSIMGRTPYGVAIFLYAVLRNAGKQGATPHVYIVASEDTERYADELIIHLSAHLGLDSGYFDILKVDPRDVEDVYQQIREKGLFAKGVSFVDITGGTKVMASALLGAAYTMSMLRGGSAVYFFYSYVPHEDKPVKTGYPAKPYSTRIQLQGTPLEIYRDYILREALTKARAFDFDSANQLLDSLKAYALKTETKSYAEALQNIVGFLGELAYLRLGIGGLKALMKRSNDDFKYLREELGVNLRPIPLRRFIERLKRIGRLLKHEGNPLKGCRGDTGQCARDMLFFAYILYLIGLSWEKKFPALSTQIYYRVVEMALQSYLLSKGIWVGGKTPLEELEALNLPKPLFEQLASKARIEEKVVVVNLALRDDAEIVNTIAGRFPDFDSLNDYTQARNTSILAHGLYRPKSGDTKFDMLKNYVPRILGYTAALLGTSLDELREDAQPVEAILGINM